MSTRFLPRLALLTALPLSLSAAEPALLEPAEAGPDFAVQGEYVGENCGAQVIALGGGKFHIVGWNKGLPGTVPDVEKKVEIDATASGESVPFDGGGWKGTISGGKLSGKNEEGRTWELKKTERHSPTEGAKPPAGAVVLFDGTSAEAWENGKVDARGLLAGGTKTKQTFEDFTLHVEFRTPFMPTARGQGRGNSGVYLQNRYECQVLDSFGLKGEDNETGGLYHQSKPALNMCFPPLSWQTYDIDFQAAKFDDEGTKYAKAKVTVKLNGVVVQDGLELTGPTPGAGLKDTADPGPILFQNHGNPVFYRNVWIVAKTKKP